MDAMNQKNNDLKQKLEIELAKTFTFTTLQDNFSKLQHEMMQTSQNLMNEKMKVEMLRNTLTSVMYQHVRIDR